MNRSRSQIPCKNRLGIRVLFCFLFLMCSRPSQGKHVILTGSIQSNSNTEIVLSGFRTRSINDIGTNYTATVDDSGRFSLTILNS
jgi:hypothetical protein